MKRKLLYILITLCLVVMLLTGCKESNRNQTEPTTDKVVTEKRLLNEARWVKANPSLRVRDSAGTEGTKLGLIPYGEKVTLIEESGEEQTIFGTTGKWSRVKWNELDGWVFGGFLSKELPLEKLLVGEWEGNRYDNDDITKDVDGNIAIVKLNLKANGTLNYELTGFYYSKRTGTWKIIDNKLLETSYNETSDKKPLLYTIVSLTDNKLKLIIDDKYGKLELDLNKK